MDTQDLTKKLHETIEFLREELKNIRSGRATPGIVEDVNVQAYDTPTPLNQLASISTPDTSSIVIEPWDKSILKDIEKGIEEANIGLQPVNEGERIRLKLPPLTEERREEIAKIVRQKEEEAKISIRNIREDFMKDMKKEELPEDDEERMKDEVQKSVDDANDQVEKIAETKRDELLSIDSAS